MDGNGQHSGDTSNAGCLLIWECDSRISRCDNREAEVSEIHDFMFDVYFEEKTVIERITGKSVVEFDTRRFLIEQIQKYTFSHWETQFIVEKRPRDGRCDIQCRARNLSFDGRAMRKGRRTTKTKWAKRIRKLYLSI